MPGRGSDRTRAWVALLVRSGLDQPAELVEQVVAAIRQDHPSAAAEALAAQWIAEERQAWQEQARTWPAETDHDRLLSVFARLEAAGIGVLQGCEDHWAARDLLDRAAPRLRGVLWFTAPDVWHAVEVGMLEVNLWHPSGANAAAGDELLSEVLEAFAEAGLRAVFDEGRVEVAAFWQRRPEVRAEADAPAHEV